VILFYILYPRKTAPGIKCFSKNYLKLPHLSCDDETTRDQRWDHDRLAAIREIYESFNDECMSCIVPGEYLSLDETLYRMRTQIGFKQYNPPQSTRTHLLVHLMPGNHGAPHVSILSLEQRRL